MKLKIGVFFLFLINSIAGFSQVQGELLYTKKTAADSLSIHPLQKKGDSLVKKSLALYRKKPDKKTYVKEGTYLEFYLQPVSGPGCVSCCPQKLEGYFEKCTKDSVWFDVEYWAKIYNDSGGHHYINSVNYNAFKADPEPVIYSFGYDEIKTVYYNPPLRQSLNLSSNVIMVLSGISALVVSPLANINKEGGFNGSRYLRMAGWSLAGFGFGLTLNLLTMEREYKVVADN